ncbi:MAG TPA: PLP-dependent aminotransferase family protein, partial [Verrucomicrobiae bacterium]
MSTEKEPVYQKLAGLLEHTIRNEALRPGDRVPSVRQFSRQQRVSVPTALQAYALLETRGLIAARPKSGFFVRAQRADLVREPVHGQVPLKAANPTALSPLDALLSDHANPHLVPLGAAVPSGELLPGDKLARSMGAIARQLGPRSIDYDMAPGSELLRRELARRSLDYGCALTADDFIITAGDTEALSLALRALCRPGDTVVVESPTYYGLLDMLRELELQVLSIRLHGAEGLDLDALEQALRRKKVAACALIPNYNNPAGTLMPDANKRRLLEILAARQVPLIEDDIYGDLQHEGERPRCVKTFDTQGNVLLCGSFSKSLAPGYRIGYIAPGQWYDRVLRLKKVSSLAGATLPALAVAEFLRNG